MRTPPASPLLERLYEVLELDRGVLLTPSDSPDSSEDPTAWQDHGEWLMLAQRLRAERVFFVGDDPVLVFATLPAETDEAEILRLYRRAWSMARPRCLFVEIGPELRVYNLDAPPSATSEKDPVQPVDIVRRAVEIQEVLGRFHRDRFESGAALEDADLGPSSGRADRQLLRDVEVATRALQDAGLTPASAHSLIERAVLVRYLEDRGVLTDEYFDEVRNAHGDAEIRDFPTSAPNFGRRSRFVEFLSDQALTEALFADLARQFNGDLFVVEPHRGDSVTGEHLELLRGLLCGGSERVQEPLFLWAYDFSVVPTSLVATMYELFYNEEIEGDTSSTYYTPPELVEFVVADALDERRLSASPVVCDPACGSGIFLVEAFRRIVRYEAAKYGGPLPPDRLRSILLNRVAGTDIDEAAVRLAAFSLYIAFLNYQTPQDIRQAGPLPRLIHRPSAAAESAMPLVVADVFSPLEAVDRPDPACRALPWKAHSFDVVIGNPPWTEPKKATRYRADTWAKHRKLPVGDRSPSQLFLWRSLDLLRENGLAALLVSAKVLFNNRSTSRRFRSQWLRRVSLERVINFSEVRHDFFEHAVAPFALLRFRHGESPGSVIYETARPVARGRRGSVALARLDRRVVDQRTLMANDVLWKTYSAGDHRDHGFIARLGLDSRLGDLTETKLKPQFGFQRATVSDRSGHPTPPSWAHLGALRTFESWGPLRDAWIEDVPKYVKFDAPPEMFLQPKLVVRRFVSPSFGPHARLISEPMAFRHHIYGIPLGDRPEWHAQVALGTMLSALGRYWLFMVSGAWGTWKDEIRAEQILDMPVRIVESHPATSTIVSAVGQLASVTGPDSLQLDLETGYLPKETVLRKLDEAVFDLFDVTDAERSLVADFWASRDDKALTPIRLEAERDDLIRAYVEVFSRVWRPLLDEQATWRVRFAQDRSARVVAAAFELVANGEGGLSLASEDEEWTDVLDRYSVAVDSRSANRLLVQGEMRAVTPSAVIVVKRNERQLWSTTAARKDAEAAAAQLLALQNA